MKKILLLIILLSLTAVLTLSNQHYSYKKEIHAAAKKNFHALTVSTAQEVDFLAKQVMNVAKSFADELTNGTIAQDTLENDLKELLIRDTRFHGIGVAFKPFVFNQETELYAPYWHKSSSSRGILIFRRIDETHNYTEPGRNSYFNPMTNKKNSWSEPFWDEVSSSFLVTYSALFYKANKENGEKEPIGVVTIDVSLEHIEKVIQEAVDHSGKGFGALTTGTGRYLYHHIRDYVISGKTLFDIAEEKKDKDRLAVAEKARLSQGGIIDHISTTTAEESWLIVEPVRSSGWSLQNTFIKDDIELNQEVLRHRIILIILSGTVLLLSVLLLILTWKPFSKEKNIWMLWLTVIFFSIILSISIGAVWKTALTYIDNDYSDEVRIQNQQVVDRTLASYFQMYKDKSLDPPVDIPTGIYIESMNFQSANELSISGKIWQKYPSDLPDDLKKIHIFPAKKSKIEQIYLEHTGDKEIIRWRFEVHVPVLLSYSKYPLQMEVMGVQFYSMDTNRIFFVPNNDQVGAAVRLPGLNKNVFLPGWEISQTFFAFAKKDAETDFGIKANFDQEELPVLSYRIGIKRNVIDAFISNLTPLIVVTVILFFIFFLPLAVNIGTILGICTSLFFVVVYSHLAIRRSIAIGELFYLEYFFFIIYAAIIIIPIESYRVRTERKGKCMDYQFSMLLKAAYWPFMLSLLLLVTALVFY